VETATTASATASRSAGGPPWAPSSRAARPAGPASPWPGGGPPGEGEAAVGQHLDQHPAGRHHHQGTELGVGDHPQGQLHPGPGHGRDQHPGTEPPGKVGVGRRQPLRTVQAQPDPTHVRLVGHPGSGRLQHHRPPDPLGRDQRPLQARRDLGRHHRHSPVGQHGQPLGLVQRPGRLGQPPLPPLPPFQAVLPFRTVAPVGTVLPFPGVLDPDPAAPGPPVGERSRPGDRVLGVVHSPAWRQPGRGRGVGEEVAVEQEVGEGGQAGGGALQDRDPGGAEGGRLGSVDGAGQVGQHGHGLGGGGCGGHGQAGVAGLGGGLGGQVQVEGQGGGVGVVQQGPDAGGEDPVGVVGRAPGVQGVGGGQPRLQDRGQPVPGRLGNDGQRHPELLGQVQQVGPLAPRVVDGGQPARVGPAAGGQELAGVGQLVQGRHPGHPVGVEQGLVGAVLAGQGAGVGGHQLPGRRAAPDLEGDHRDLAGGRLGQGGPERRRLAHRLQEQGHHPGACQLQGVVQVGGGRGDELVAGDTTRLNRRPRSLWSRAENTDPEWLTTATGPASSPGGSGYPQTLKLRSRLKKPMPLPPQTAIPAPAAIARSRSASGGSAGGSSMQLAKMTAAGIPAAAAAASWASRAALGTASTARSTGAGRSARDGRQGRPATSR
jgi:hypothetical protein